MNTNFSHQAKLFDPHLARPVVIIGAGMNGSMIAFALAKMGVRYITVMDHDVVSSHNSPMSLYRPSDLGKPKVSALADILGFMTPGASLCALNRKYQGEPLPKATIICSVDDMDVRQSIWEQVKAHPVKYDLLIDTRTAAAYTEVFAVSPRLPDDVAWYDKFWYTNEEATRQMCGLHGIIYVPLAVAASVSATVARFWQTGQKRRWHPMRCDLPQDLNQEEVKTK